MTERRLIRIVVTDTKALPSDEFFRLQHDDLIIPGCEVPCGPIAFVVQIVDELQGRRSHYRSLKAILNAAIGSNPGL